MAPKIRIKPTDLDRPGPRLSCLPTVVVHLVRSASLPILRYSQALSTSARRISSALPSGATCDRCESEFGCCGRLCRPPSRPATTQLRWESGIRGIQKQRDNTCAMTSASSRRKPTNVMVPAKSPWPSTVDSDSTEIGPNSGLHPLILLARVAVVSFYTPKTHQNSQLPSPNALIQVILDPMAFVQDFAGRP